MVSLRQAHLNDYTCEQWRNEGGQGATSAPGCSTWEDAKRRSECYVVITKCSMSADANNCNVQNSNVIAKSHRDHQGSQSEQL